jgi:hypothetical protein
MKQQLRRDRALGHSYLDWYMHELKNIHEELNKAGIVTREVVFQKLHKKQEVN